MERRGFYLTTQEKAVRIEDTLTGEITDHISLNSAARSINAAGGSIHRPLNNGNLFRKRYKITYITQPVETIPAGSKVTIDK